MTSPAATTTITLMRSHRLVFMALVLTAAGVPATAGASARYASPTGSGTGCTIAQPCDVVTAVNGAADGDDVTLLPGTYTPTSVLDPGGNAVTIHGLAGQPRPVIASTALIGLRVYPGSTLAAVQIEMGDGSQIGLDATKSTVDRVIVHVPGAPATACALHNATLLTNSVCRATAPGGTAAGGVSMVFPESLALRNDTLVATGDGGVGLYATANTGGSLTITLSNSIVRGSPQDIVVSPSSSADTVALTADHSSYADVFTQGPGSASATPPGSGTNQTAAPQFLDAAAGDFREAASSPTVDAGAVSPLNGPLDFDGIPRTLGASTDIGAYEFIPPPACLGLSATTAFAQPVELQLVCSDALGAPVTYAIAGGPGHGTVALDAATGRATYTPGAGYSGADTFAFAASSSHGTGAPATATITVGPPPVVVDSQAPVLSAVTLLRTRFAVAARKTPKVAAPRGTAFRFTLSETATVKISFARLVAGRRVGKACRPASRRLRKRPPCTRSLAAGSLLRRNLGQGRHSVAFTGRIGSKALVPGRYRATLVATDPARNAGQPRALRFTIVRR